MSETDETLQQLSDRDILLNIAKDVGEIKQRLDTYDIQFEAIRIGLVQNSAAFDRLQAKVLNLTADVKELTEEVRRSKTLV